VSTVDVMSGAALTVQPASKTSTNETVMYEIWRESVMVRGYLAFWMNASSKPS
jgi:hypothetical protein